MNQIEKYNNDVHKNEINNDVKIIINKEDYNEHEAIIPRLNKSLENQRIITPNSIGIDNSNSSEESKVTQPIKRIKKKYKKYKIYSTNIKGKIIEEVSLIK